MKRLLLVVACMLVVMRTFTESAPVTSCPLYYVNSYGISNYSLGMMNNWDSYSCDSIPNSLFHSRIEGASLADYQYNVILSSNGSYCEFVNNNQVIRNQTWFLFEMFNNATMMKEYFVPYLDSLLVNKNFTVERKYFIEGFDIILEHNQLKAKLFELVNAFNYFMFCKIGNPYFKEFHTQTLPSIASQSAYTQVQTLDVLFGQNVKETCGMETIPFFNRTLLCYCSSISNNGSEIEFGTLSFFSCSSVYVNFWVPLSRHPSLRSIELVFHIIQFIVISVICLVPILSKNVQKWKGHIVSRQTFLLVEKEREERKKLEMHKVLSNNVVSTSEISTSETSVPTSLPIDKSEVVEIVPESKMKVTESSARDQVRNSMKDHLQHELLRILCDMKLLTVVTSMLGIFCICIYVLMPLVSTGLNGSAINEHYTFLSAALSFQCVANIPLAGSFVEVLLKLDGKNKSISIHGL